LGYKINLPPGVFDDDDVEAPLIELGKNSTPEELTPLTGPPKRRPFIVLDIESKDGDSQRAGFTRPFMVGVYGELEKGKAPEYKAFFDAQPGEGYWKERYFWEGGCVDRAMRFILTKRFRGHHIYAHNAGRFDYLFLLPWLMQVGMHLGYRFSIIPVASSIQVLDVWKGKKRDGFIGRDNVWRFLDSFRLIPTGLDKAAKAFGLPGKLKHNLNVPEWDPSWIQYNGQDCSELYNVLDKFHGYIENVLCGEVGITAPATAMKIFRRNYLKQSLPRSCSTHDFVRQGYFGGRVEVFESLAEYLRYFDINSSYPRAMLEPMPAGDATEITGEPPDRFWRTHIGFIEADVYVPEHIHIPVLPVRDGGTGKLIFPVGKLRGVWESEELQLAIREGAEVRRWGRSVWFVAMPIFEEYVRNLYSYRNKNHPNYDPGLADVCKNMLNASYGKFGMKTTRKQIYLYDDPKLPADATPVSSDPESVIYSAEQEVDAVYIMPQIAARVTALGRIRLFNAMKAASCQKCWPRKCECPWSEGPRKRVIYTDTDSVITPTDLANLPPGNDFGIKVSSELGDLKDEYPEVSGWIIGEFVAPKVYILKVPGSDDFPWESPFNDPFSKIKAKGLEKRNEHTIQKLARGEKVYQNRLQKIGLMARNNFVTGPELILIPRRLLTAKGKREVLKDGTTKPWVVDMWKDDPTPDPEPTELDPDSEDEEEGEEDGELSL
jgi:hypothetical protein